MLTYDQSVQFINDLPKFTTKHTADESRDFLKMLGDPQDGMRVIHVAGTNGKGSVCIYMESILMHAGYRTGCFISPHLEDMRERVRIDSKMCTEEEFADAVNTVLDAAKKLYYPSFFEFLFFAALLIFKKRETDILILETGLGGRLDATNLIDDKEITVITSIGMDHMEYLGDTPEKIACEKAGIMRTGVPAVFWRNATGDESSCEGVYNELHRCASEAGSVEYALSKDLISDVFVDNAGIDFCLKYKYDNCICLHLPTRALYQIKNAALAVVSLIIWDKDGAITPVIIREALSDTHWEGRMEEICERVILDGAHNEPGTAAFLDSVRIDGAAKRLLIYGCMKDKDYMREVSMIAGSGLFESCIAVDTGQPRALTADKLCECMREAGLKCKAAGSLKEAADEGRAFALDERHMTYIAGSLYLIGEVRGLIS